MLREGGRVMRASTAQAAGIENLSRERWDCRNEPQ
jgi:hypothetical protein